MGRRINTKRVVAKKGLTFAILNTKLKIGHNLIGDTICTMF